MSITECITEQEIASTLSTSKDGISSHSTLSNSVGWYHIIGLDAEFQLWMYTLLKSRMHKLLESEDLVSKAISITYELHEKEKIISNSYSFY